MSDRTWFKHGAWNVLEHGLSRSLDALATLLILWWVPTERFSQLVLAQAWVAPILLLFVAPEAVLYREYGNWRREGRGVVIARVRALRKFAWMKLLGAFAFSFLLALVLPTGSAEISYLDRFFSLVWAFCLALAPQIAGADRDLLRLALRLRELSWITLFQRAFYFLLLLVSVRFFAVSPISLALSSIAVAIGTACLARNRVEHQYRDVEATFSPENSFGPVIRNSLRDFSVWTHLSGVVMNWIQTLDLFFLGLVGTSANLIGIYGVVLKLANFTLALPYAFANLFAVRLGRAESDSVRTSEWSDTIRASALLMGFAGVQAAIFRGIAPWGIAYLSRGRWSPEDQVQMLGWLNWILPASAVFASLLFWIAWLTARTSVRAFVARVSLPWGIAALGIYGSVAYFFGPNGTALANGAVVLLLVPLLIFATVRARESSEKGATV